MNQPNMEKTPSSQEFNPQDVDIEVYKELHDYLTKLFMVVKQTTLNDEYKLDCKHGSYRHGENWPGHNSWFDTFYLGMDNLRRSIQFAKDLPLENGLNTLCVIRKTATEARKNVKDMAKQGKARYNVADDISHGFTVLARDVEDELPI